MKDKEGPVSKGWPKPTTRSPLAMQGASPPLASYKPIRTLHCKPIRTLVTLSPIPYIRRGRGLTMGTATIFLDRII